MFKLGNVNFEINTKTRQKQDKLPFLYMKKMDY